jgi:hypothetical protein
MTMYLMASTPYNLVYSNLPVVATVVAAAIIIGIILYVCMKDEK